MKTDPLLYWMKERHAIYLRRAEGQRPPWTNDAVLQQFHFCNVYRELDRTTIWVRKYIRELWYDSHHLWFALMAARFFNLPSTMKHIISKQGLPLRTGEGYNAGWLADLLRQYRAAGNQLFANAYMVRSRPDTPKSDYIAHEVLGGAWAERHDIDGHLHGDIEPAVRRLSCLSGLAGFMSYEVATDLRHCPGWLDKATDTMTYAHVGPGAVRGLNRLNDRPLKHPLPQGQALDEMRFLLSVIGKAWQMHWYRVPTPPPPLEMRDIEHSLCEMDKYLRAKSGVGAVRRYRPRPPLSLVTS